MPKDKSDRLIDKRGQPVERHIARLNDGLQRQRKKMIQEQEKVKKIEDNIKELQKRTQNKIK